MQLILSDGDLAAAAVLDVVFQFLEVADTVVGDTDRTDLAGLLVLNQGLPCAQTTFLAAVGSVDQHPGEVLERSLGIELFVYAYVCVQVNVVQLACSETSLEGTLGALVVLQKANGDLAGEEDLGPVDTGLADGLCAFRLVLVVLCAVDLDT